MPALKLGVEALLLAGGLVSSAVAGPAPSVAIDYVNVTGRTDGVMDEFFGIPYASAGRFEHSTLYTQQLGDFDGSNYGAICPQKSAASIMAMNSSSGLLLGDVGVELGPLVGNIVDNIYNFTGLTRAEDCLFVNVQRPANTSAGDNLPVVFMIHGGGFEVGSPYTDISESDVVRGAAINYNLGGLVRTSAELGLPVVGVSVNYRLNAFGFSGGREMAEAGLINLGIEDQRVGMRWVQKYISQFGGDPTKVTIMGESAGAWSVAAHLLWDDGEGEGVTDLFRAAVAMSGGPVMVNGPERSQGVFDNMVAAAGCSSAADKIACLKTAPFESIMDSINEEGYLLGPRSLASTWTIRPDGKHLKQSPHLLAAAGKATPVPLMVGDMRDEGTLFSLVAQLETMTDADFQSYFQTVWWPNATDADMQSLMSLYPADPAQGSPFGTGAANALTPNFKRLAAVVGDYSFQAQRRNLIAHHNATVYNYINDVTLPLDGFVPALVQDLLQLPILGSHHAFDVWYYVFAQIPYALSANTRARQATLLSFIRTLDPNNHGVAEVPNWPPYTADGLETFNFKESGAVLTTDDYRKEAMEFINSRPESFLI